MCVRPSGPNGWRFEKPASGFFLMENLARDFMFMYLLVGPMDKAIRLIHDVKTLW